MFPADILAMAEEVLAAARAKGLRIAAAESCTGGLVAGALTAIAGSSDVFERGFVTYSNAAKTEMLGVDPDLITAQGAVSLEVATAMADGAVAHSGADVSVAVTGIAGPGGGSLEKPVGLVCFSTAWARSEEFQATYGSSMECRFGDLGRAGIREESVRQALRLLLIAVQTRQASPGRRPGAA
jgi:nicotinamide-nucleotide amidase